MITHYDIKQEAQELKQILTSEGINIPSLLQIIRPGGAVFLFMLGWIILVRWLSEQLTYEFVWADILFSGFLGLMIFIAISNATSLYNSIPEGFRKKSKVINLIRDKTRNYILAFLVVFALLPFVLPPFAYCFGLMIIIFIFLMIYSIDMGRYRLSAITSIIEAFRKEPVS
ncbi:conjugal transfer protein TraS [Salmonella enterica subsp. enterica]|nr:conjugal transfer protein TraS [Salmonella enterica subsp. enterica serovar Lomalinda]ECI3619873.1 conjugal transfer protein TraS [Salmonella enterica subsp. enterica]ECI5320394.1 conjugal transfer protein TraS [Salmonella enterica subsp. enterica serovar Lomalinda]EDU0501843.1 conjugal transfer entry exclusion protein TraS [Salmonella enterica subsp. salamae]